MDTTQFKQLIKKIEANYTSCTGSIAQMRGCNKHNPLSICCSSFRNEGEFVPTQCIVWDDNKIVYEGKLKSGLLKAKLNKYKRCCAEITSADEIEANTPGEFICFGDPETCPDKKCKYKTIQMARNKEEEDDLEKQADELIDKCSELLKAVWKQEIKKQKRSCRDVSNDTLY